MQLILEKIKKYKFVFSELVKRDFKKRYKRSVLGVLWSMLAPLFQLMVMTFVFKRVFGRQMEHYTIYLFAGQLVFSYFKEATNTGMSSIISNSGIITKVNTPKYLFLISKIMAASINFLLTFIIFFVFALADKIKLTWRVVTLIYPVICLFLLIVGAGLILSALINNSLSFGEIYCPYWTLSPLTTEYCFSFCSYLSFKIIGLACGQ